MRFENGLFTPAVEETLEVKYIIGRALEYITWSNTLTPKPQFHVPERFGVVHFDGRPGKIALRI